jgi:DNA repair exonuclease SbcCD nuclease subunit
VKALWVGDPHAEPNDLEDCQALVDYIAKIGRDEHPNLLILAGDLYHTHAIIHAEVQYFWYRAFEQLSSIYPEIIVIKGNHDAPGTERSRATALLAHVKQVTVVAHDPVFWHGCMFLPFSTPDQIVKWSEEYAPVITETLFCHQDFYGATYDNGAQIDNGLNPNLIKQKSIISGHVHKPQEFGKVWYPGAPRWRTLSDASSDSRSLWLLNIDKGRVVSKKDFPMAGTVRQIFHFVDTEAEPIHVKPLPGNEYRVDIHGSKAWIEKRKPEFEAWAKVRTIRTDTSARVVVKESDGLAVAFSKYAASYKPARGTPVPVLVEMVRERVAL